MNAIEILIDIPGAQEPKAITAESDAVVIEVLKKVAPGPVEEFYLIIEGDDKALGNEERLHQRGVRHRHRLHCRHGLHVEFIDSASSDAVHFHVEWHQTLQQALTEAYSRLKEAPKPDDELVCEKNKKVSLMPYLNKTFHELRKEHICPDHKYLIRRGSGGA